MRPDLQLAHQLLAVTLELELALLSNDGSADVLLNRRAELLETLDQVMPGPEALLLFKQCQEHEHRILAQLATFKSQLASELGDLTRAQRQAKAYLTAA